MSWTETDPSLSACDVTGNRNPFALSLHGLVLGPNRPNLRPSKRYKLSAYTLLFTFGTSSLPLTVCVLEQHLRSILAIFLSAMATTPEPEARGQIVSFDLPQEIISLILLHTDLPTLVRCRLVRTNRLLLEELLTICLDFKNIPHFN